MTVQMSSSAFDFAERVAPLELSPLHQSGAIVRGGLAPWQEKRVIRFIVENALTHIEVSSLAAISRLSISHFSRAFRASFGMSPYAMVCRCRIEEAKRLLVTSDWTLIQIANACGFSDQSHFTRQFHRYTQASPGRWRRTGPSCLPDPLGGSAMMPSPIMQQGDRHD